MLRRLGLGLLRCQSLGIRLLRHVLVCCAHLRGTLQGGVHRSYALPCLLLGLLHSQRLLGFLCQTGGAGHLRRRSIRDFLGLPCLLLLGQQGGVAPGLLRRNRGPEVENRLYV